LIIFVNFLSPQSICVIGFGRWRSIGLAILSARVHQNKTSRQNPHRSHCALGSGIFICSQLHSTSESDFTSFLDAVLLHALVAAEIITQSSCSQNTHAFAQQNTPVHRARLLSTFQQKIFSKGE
jgi:hypothetical protein